MNTIYLLTMKYISTRGNSQNLQFEDVLLTGLSPDGGLYVPKEWPILNYSELKNDKYHKIAAEIFNGLEIVPFKENTKIFYHADDPSNETNLHFSNILEPDGKIFVKNDILNIKVESLDILFIDKNNDECILDLIHESTDLLKKRGFLLFSSLLKSQKSENSTNFLIRQMKQKNFSLIQEVNLSDYFKDQILVIMQKNQ